MSQTKAQLIDGKAASVEFSGGSASTPSITFDGDVNTGIFSPAADTIAFAEGGSEAARIDSSGRLLVGTSSASTNAPTVQAQGPTTGDSSGRLIISRGSTGVGTSTGTYWGSINFENNGSLIAGRISCEVDAAVSAGESPGRLVFSTTADGASSPTERMRISQNGQTEYRNCPFVGPITDNATLLGGSGYRWSQVWAANGTIQTSDQRTKTAIADASLGSDFIKSLRPVSYKWIEGGKVDSGRRDDDGNYIYESVPGERTHWGFIAQEVKQAVDAAGVDFGGWVLTDKDDPDSQQALRYDQFIAPLTKALQEALHKIDELKAEVNELKAKLP